jgi:hypothetical protein
MMGHGAVKLRGWLQSRNLPRQLSLPPMVPCELLLTEDA